MHDDGHQKCEDLVCSESFFAPLFSAQGQSPAVKNVLSNLHMDILLPYSQLLLFSQAELPDSCLALGLQEGLTRWYIFSEAEELRQTKTELTVLLQVGSNNLRTYISGICSVFFKVVLGA